MFHAPQVVCDLRKKLELEQCVLPAVLQASQSRLKSKNASRWDIFPLTFMHLTDTFIQSMTTMWQLDALVWSEVWSSACS